MKIKFDDYRSESLTYDSNQKKTSLTFKAFKPDLNFCAKIGIVIRDENH